jgi:hypothetical protein
VGCSRRGSQTLSQHEHLQVIPVVTMGLVDIALIIGVSLSTGAVGDLLTKRFVTGRDDFKELSRKVERQKKEGAFGKALVP